ncbi:hypothetical protein CC117_01545 [Parafrankia colletiae]|uniref:Uncharacterized protein n=1 Tax=Parafrankia colletiae TaxID=573497 RepID=A0A1S1RM42_9ACTN|nr:hypothetical protein [Parafrankia colletiae]MCK9899767.1 hypothetical protein [Frankia sp. Cpl3]OHV46352.1 hypothetical protein CC117_01545 [Parafrankia colletiae]
MSGTSARGRRPRSSVLTITVAAVGLLSIGGLAACSSGDSPSSPPPAPKAAGSAGLPGYDSEKGARTEAIAGDCDRSDDGEWLFDGTVNNRGKKPRAYSIVVDFVTDEGSTAIDTRIVKVPGVRPGSSADWSVAGAEGRDDLRCVIRNVQFD